MRSMHKREKATRLYTFVLQFYPQGYRQVFGSQMLQTFKDHYIDVVDSGQQTEGHFWFDVLCDEVRGILCEQFVALKESLFMSNTWVKQGIYFGMMLGIIHIGYDLVNNLAPANEALNKVLNNGILLVVLIFTSCAGYISAHKTGRIKTGTWAGLCTGLLSIAIGTIALFVITFVFMGIISQNAFMLYDFQHSGLKSIDQFIIEDATGATIIGTLFSLLAGGIFGTVGGYLGKRSKEQGA